ncbi:hypothetical protein KO561_18085 [Radiobacillus kanasensis]|uniref:hypothetical protein n=1 Tax=Radiobacillus kanasensis TaxID=2844358 RepID=UPI001E349F3B|nr:hypothetical protein [Radiobacillus kanasensis]UFT99071.1 hypothetical protein KO561_18085 [Radiobacillus kanasensis]
MEPGDIVYSTKGWSTFLVGHAGIVGHDMLIHHSHPLGAFSESFSRYKSRHKYGGSILVLRPRGNSDLVAAWAEENIDHVQRYLFDPWLRRLSNNYCSKFIWQAFWNGAQVDLTNHNLSANRISWVYPYQIKQSSYLKKKGIIRLPSIATNKKNSHS